MSQSWLWSCRIWPIFVESGATQSAGWLVLVPSQWEVRKAEADRRFLFWFNTPFLYTFAHVAHSLCFAHDNLVTFIYLMKRHISVLHSGGTRQFLHSLRNLKPGSEHQRRAFSLELYNLCYGNIVTNQHFTVKGQNILAKIIKACNCTVCLKS